MAAFKEHNDQKQRHDQHDGIENQFECYHDRHAKAVVAPDDRPLQA
jgi:hypothetical protein